MRAVAGAGLPLDRFMVGTGAAALDDACRLTAEARSLGFAGALLLPPFYYKGLDADGVVGYVEALIGKVGADGLKLYLYHGPANSGVPYTPEIVARVRSLEHGYPEVAREGLADGTVRDVELSGVAVAMAGAFGWLHKWFSADLVAPEIVVREQVRLLAGGLTAR